MWVLEAPRPAPSLCVFLLVPQLLEYEPRSGEQVPLLLKMKRSKLALSKAIESGDTDLGEHGLGEDEAGDPGLSKGLGWIPIPPYRPTVFTVLLHLKNELNRGDFFMTLRNQPMALSLYRQVCAGAGWGGACRAPELALLTAHLLSPVL